MTIHKKLFLARYGSAKHTIDSEFQIPEDEEPMMQRAYHKDFMDNSLKNPFTPEHEIDRRIEDYQESRFIRRGKMSHQMMDNIIDNYDHDSVYELSKNKHLPLEKRAKIFDLDPESYVLGAESNDPMFKDEKKMEEFVKSPDVHETAKKIYMKSDAFHTSSLDHFKTVIDHVAPGWVPHMSYDEDKRFHPEKLLALAQAAHNGPRSEKSWQLSQLSTHAAFDIHQMPKEEFMNVKPHYVSLLKLVKPAEGAQLIVSTRHHSQDLADAIRNKSK